VSSAALNGSHLNEAFSGVFALLLTVRQLVRGSWARGSGTVCPSACGYGPGRGWSGRAGGWPARVCPQVQPGLLAVVATGQVEGQVAAAVPGGPCGHRDQVAADGGGPGSRVTAAGAGTDGTQQVMRHRGEHEPGGVRGEDAGGKMSERAGGQVFVWGCGRAAGRGPGPGARYAGFACRDLRFVPG
jgi:hypothetical protein